MIRRVTTIHAVLTFVALGALSAVAMGEFDLHKRIAAAASGETITVPAGEYGGPVQINKPLTLVADGEVIFNGNGQGDVVTITAPDVTLRGFIIENTGDSLDRENAGVTVLKPRAVIENNTLRDVLFGIYLKKAEESIIRNNTIGGKDLGIARRGDGIRLWYSKNVLIENNTVTRSRDAVMWFSDNVTLRHNIVTHGRYGLHFMYSDNNVLEHNRLRHNSVGAFLMYSRNLTLRENVFMRNRGPSGYGIGLKDMDRVVAEDNVFIGNRIGVYLDNSPWSMNVHDDFRRNVFAYNDIGVAFQPSVKRNRFTNNTFFENQQQVAVLGGGNFSGNDFTIDGRGNYWSDYRGYDLDGDGIGDLPYESVSLFEDLMNRESNLRLFLHSPAQQAIDMAARAFPVVQPRPKFTDEAPLMQPVRAAVSVKSDQSPATMAGAALLLLIAAIAVPIVGGVGMIVMQPGPATQAGEKSRTGAST